MATICSSIVRHTPHTCIHGQSSVQWSEHWRLKLEAQGYVYSLTHRCTLSQTITAGHKGCGTM